MQIEDLTKPKGLDVEPSSEGESLGMDEKALKDKTIDELREVVRYLRKEKDLLEQRVAVAEREVLLGP